MHGRTVYVVGAASSAFSVHPQRSFQDLATEVFDGVVRDAGLPSARYIDGVWFGNCAMGTWGQDSIRGQVALSAQVRSESLAPGTPIINVEGGCATGSLALHGAVQAVRSGQCDVALALGVEKVLHPDDPKTTFGLFAHGADRHDPHGWRQFVAAQAADAGLSFQPHPMRVVFLDVHALLAQAHMKRHGTTLEQIAAVCAQTHGYALDNERAQIRKALTVQQILADKPIVGPLTRAMCAPISDGAAAVLVASEPAAAAIAVRATALAGGRWRTLDQPSVTALAGERAFAQAGLSPADVQTAEVHDATSFCQIDHVEQLGLCPAGQGGAWSISPEAIPVNRSGGLVSKGHPLGATGLGMIHELTLQLRDGNGAIALAHNAGGLTALDEALASVVLLERTA